MVYRKGGRIIVAKGKDYMKEIWRKVMAVKERKRKYNGEIFNAEES